MADSRFWFRRDEQEIRFSEQTNSVKNSWSVTIWQCITQMGRVVLPMLSTIGEYFVWIDYKLGNKCCLALINLVRQDFTK